MIISIILFSFLQLVQLLQGRYIYKQSKMQYRLHTSFV